MNLSKKTIFFCVITIAPCIANASCNLRHKTMQELYDTPVDARSSLEKTRKQTEERKKIIEKRKKLFRDIDHGVQLIESRDSQILSLYCGGCPIVSNVSRFVTKNIFCTKKGKEESILKLFRFDLRQKKRSIEKNLRPDLKSSSIDQSEDGILKIPHIDIKSLGKETNVQKKKEWHKENIEYLKKLKLLSNNILEEEIRLSAIASLENQIFSNKKWLQEQEQEQEQKKKN